MKNYFFIIYSALQPVQATSCTDQVLRLKPAKATHPLDETVTR